MTITLWHERIWKQHRFTTVLITHDVGEAVALADRVLVLREGRIRLDATVGLPGPHTDPQIGKLQEMILQHV